MDKKLYSLRAFDLTGRGGFVGLSSFRSFLRSNPPPMSHSAPQVEAPPPPHFPKAYACAKYLYTATYRL